MSIVLIPTHPLPYLPWLYKRLKEKGIHAIQMVDLFDQAYRKAKMGSLDTTAHRMIQTLLNKLNSIYDEIVLSSPVRREYDQNDERFKDEIELAFSPLKEIMCEIERVSPLP